MEPTPPPEEPTRRQFVRRNIVDDLKSRLALTAAKQNATIMVGNSASSFRLNDPPHASNASNASNAWNAWNDPIVSDLMSSASLSTRECNGNPLCKNFDLIAAALLMYLWSIGKRFQPGNASFNAEFLGHMSEMQRLFREDRCWLVSFVKDDINSRGIFAFGGNVERWTRHWKQMASSSFMQDKAMASTLKEIMSIHVARRLGDDLESVKQAIVGDDFDRILDRIIRKLRCKM